MRELSARPLPLATASQLTPKSFELFLKLPSLPEFSFVLVDGIVSLT